MLGPAVATAPCAVQLHTAGSVAAELPHHAVVAAPAAAADDQGLLTAPVHSREQCMLHVVITVRCVNICEAAQALTQGTRNTVILL